MAMGSVLYVTESPEVEEGKLAHAQQYALPRNLPYAVVYCVEVVSPNDQLKHIRAFRELERYLQSFSIPFMILIGKREKVLPWMSGHVKPVRIFTDENKVTGTPTLRRHPIAWPGRVMTIAELEALITSDQSYCQPD